MTWPRVSAGERRDWITLTEPDGDPQPDGDGGFTQPMKPLTPAGLHAKIVPATARVLERAMAGTIASAATHVVTMPYHAGVTTATVITYNGRTLQVAGVSNPDEREIETVVAVIEAVR